MNTKHFNAAIKFGRQLIETGDLDPVYIAIHGAKLSNWEKARLILAYSCLYHLGAAAHIASFKKHAYWSLLQRAAENIKSPMLIGRWPRGAERRHWRGQNAIKSAAWLAMNQGWPEDVVEYWMRGDPLDALDQTFASVVKRISETPSFGPWIAFKLVDLFERVMGEPIGLSGCELAIYEAPRAGAALLLYGQQDNTNLYRTDINHVIQKMLKEFAGVKAPPAYDRSVNIMEMETVLCKYKSMVNGHYHVGKDIHELRVALSEPAWGPLAKVLLKHVPVEVKR